MSGLLDALIDQRRKDAIKYEQYLAKIIDLTRQAMNPFSNASYPATMNTSSKRALYDNLGNDESLAAAVDAVVRSEAQADWSSNGLKTKKVRLGIKSVLGEDDALVDQILELVKHQNGY